MGLSQRDVRRIMKWLRALGLDKRLGIWFLPLALVLAGLVWLGQVLWQDYGDRLTRPGQQLACAVAKVADGDTVTLNCQMHQVKVRVWGIDAPEMGQQPWGSQSRDALAELLGNQVTLRTQTRDRYGRVVGRLYRDGEDVGLALVRNGHARVYERYNDHFSYQRAEAEAKRAERGIWRVAGMHQTPWEWRHQ